jgi:hypothetical protein
MKNVQEIRLTVSLFQADREWPELICPQILKTLSFQLT